MKWILLLLALASCAHELCAASDNLDGAVGKFIKRMLSKDYKKEYDKINDWLVDNIASREAPDNIAAVKEHFLLETSAKQPLGIVEAAKQLVSMADDSLEKVKCTPEAAQILEANQASTRHYLDDNLMRRIDRIVHHYSRKHSLDCKNVYPLMTSKATNGYESPSAKLVARFVDSSRLPTLAELYTTGEKKFLASSERSTIATVAVDVINSQEPEPIEPEQSEKTGKRHLDKQKIESLVNKYIFEPCEEFIPQVKSIMIPLSIDKRTQAQNYNLFQTRDMIRTIVGYNWCNVALGDRKSILQAIQNHLYKKFSLH